MPQRIGVSANLHYTPLGVRGGFVGREAELEMLAASLEEARARRGGCVLLVGEAGIGKTRTAEVLAEHAVGLGGRAIWGRCIEGEGAPAFWPWRHVLRALDAESVLADVAVDASGGGVGEPAPSWADGARFRLFDAITSVLARAADAAPLVVLLDDLHWADHASLRLLEFVAQAVRDAHVLVVGTCRDVEMRRSPDGPRVLESLARTSERISLGGLTEADVGRLVAERVPATVPPDLITAIHRASDGNPFFVGEFVRLLRLREGVLPHGVPEGVRDVVRRRLEPLSPGARELLAVAAVAGIEFDVGVVVAASKLSPAGACERLNEAADLDLVRGVPGHPGRRRFAHGIVRDAIYQEMPGARTATLHRRVAEVLAATPSARHAELAHHFFQTGDAADAARAVEHATRAGEQAMAQLAYDDAVAHFARALAGLAGNDLRREQAADAQLRLLLQLGDACWRAGDVPRSRAAFHDAVRLARRRGDGEALARAALGSTQGDVTAVVDEAAIRSLEEAASVLPPDDSPLRAAVLARLARALYFTDAEARRLALAADAVAMARRTRDRQALVATLAAQHVVLWRPGDLAARTAVCEELLRLAEDTGDLHAAIDARFCHTIACLEAGDLRGVDDDVGALERGVADARLPFFRWNVLLHRAMRALLAGRLDEAERLALEAVAARPAEGADNGAQFFGVQLYTIRREQGRTAELETQVRALAAAFPRLPIWRAGLALLELEIGRRGAAERHLEALVVDDLRALPRDANWIPAVAILAEVAAAVGDVARSRTCYEALRPHAGKTLVLGAGAACWGALARWVGLAACAAGEHDAGVTHLEAALAANAGMGAEPAAAHVELDLARALEARADGDDQARAAALRARARETALALGLERLRARLDEDAPASMPARGAAVEAALRCDGDFWTARFAGSTIRVKPSEGLRQLARLLAQPGRAIAAVDLMGGGDPGDAGEMLDAQARATYRARLASLRDDVAEAEQLGQRDVASRLREEVSALAAELTRAVGLGGVARRAASPANRARVNATRTIRRAIAHLAASHPALGDHLRRTVRTGFFCSYQPDPRTPVAWTLSDTATEAAVAARRR